MAVVGRALAVLAAAGLMTGLALAAPAFAGTTHARPTQPSAKPAGLALPAARPQKYDGPRHPAQQATTTVTGVVRTAAGAPLAGVCVTAYGASDQRSGVTNTAGRYFITGLGTGRYQLEYRSCGGSRSTSYLPAWYGNALQRAGSRTVVLGSSSLRVVQPLAPVTLYPADSVLGDLPSVVPQHGSDVVASDSFGLRRPVAASAAGLAQSVFAAARRAGHLAPGVTSRKARGAISGVVSDPSGRGLKGICVEAASLNTFAVSETRTGAGGRYSMKVPAGPYEMAFYAGCGNFGNWLFQIYKNVYSSLTTPTTVTVRRAHTTTINVALKLGGEISGTVRGPDGQKLSGICVTPMLVHGSDELYFSAVARDGVYRARGLPPGSYQVGFAPCGNSTYAPTLWPATQNYLAASVLSIKPGTVIRNINEVMQRGGVITGTVTSATTPPAALASMCVYVAEDSGLYDSGSAITSASGGYTVKGLPPGPYTVLSFPGCPQESNYVAASRKVAVYTGTTDSGVNLALPVGDIISGTVTSAATGKPVDGICVAVSLSNGPLVDEVTSVLDGTYSVDQLAAGTYQVQFAGGCGSAGSYVPQGYDNTSVFDPQNISIPKAGETLTGINAAMQPGPQIRGIVRDASGQRLSGICVEAVTPAGIVFSEGVSISGSYRLPNLAPGQYEVVFGPGCGNDENLQTEWYPSQLNPAATVSAGSGTVTGINAALPAAGGISGVIRTAAGKPVQSSCITLTGLSGLAKGEVGDIVLDGARYDLAGVPTGTWQVAFVPACAGLNYATQYYKDQPSPPFATYINVRPLHTVTGVSSALVAGGSISGRLTSAGKPASQVCVQAQNSSVVDDYGVATSGSDGDYSIYGLNTGYYELEAYPCGPASSDLATVILPTVHVSAPRNTGGVDAGIGLAGTMTGRVLGGSPVTAQPNVCAEAIPASGVGGGLATTTPSGDYTITGLTPGAYTVYVGDQGCTYGDQDLAPLWYADATTQSKAQVVQVAGGRNTSLSPVTLQSDGAISGSVSQKGAGALSGVCVAATQTSPEPGLPVYAVTGSTGSYSIIDLPPGTYRVQFSAGCGATGYRTQWWNDASSIIAAAPIMVTTGTTTTGISAVLQK